MKKYTILLLITILLISVQSCTRYSEGPMLSLRSKTERVANSWKVGQALENGKDVTPDYNKFELDLSEEGSAALSVDYTIFGGTYKYITNGSWDFVGNKEKLSFDFENDDADGVYTILRLKEKEMWLAKDGETVELHFIPR